MKMIILSMFILCSMGVSAKDSWFSKAGAFTKYKTGSAKKHSVNCSDKVNTFLNNKKNAESYSLMKVEDCVRKVCVKKGGFVSSVNRNKNVKCKQRAIVAGYKTEGYSCDTSVTMTCMVEKKEG